MNVKVEEINSIRKKLSFEVAAERVDREVDNAFRKIAKTAKIKGFRQGKIPQAVLEKYYADQMAQDVLGKLINESYFKALDEHAIPAVGEPKIIDSSSVTKGQPFTYAAEVEVKPVVTAKDYTGIALQKEKYVDDPKLVEGRLQELLTSRAQLEVSKRKKAREGDTVTIDFVGSIDGVPFEGGQGEDFQLELGSGSFIPGFEDQVAGMQRDQEKDVEVSFPENYGQKDLAGKPAVFKVKLKEIKEKVSPQLDDEFAKEFGLESLDELKKQLGESHRTQETGRIENDLRERLVSVLVERNPIEVPDAMVAEQLKYMYENIVNRMQSQGLKPEMLGITPENFLEHYRGTAESQVKGSLLLEAIGDQEKIEVAEDEIDSKLEEIATMANAPLDAVKKYYARAEARDGLLAQIREEKVIRFLLDKAKVKEVAADKLKEKTAEKEAS